MERLLFSLLTCVLIVEIQGDTYVRWGRSRCPTIGSSTFVYEGVAAGGLYYAKGNGANYLCLHSDPSWLNYNDSGSIEGSFIYGTKYKGDMDSIISHDNAEVLLDYTVPCVVCYVPTTIMMIPGRERCISGWSFEYAGYLVTEEWRHEGRMSYVCLDEAPEVIPGSNNTDLGTHMYLVEGVCSGVSALPCPPYVEMREMACVVCSKQN